MQNKENVWNYEPPKIFTLEEFKAKYDVPTPPATPDGQEQQDILYQKWLINAHDQLNSLSNGKLYTDYPHMDATSENDQKEIYIVKSCIGDLLEYYILTAKAYADQDKQIQASVPFNVKTKALDGNLEIMRSDILIKYANTRWYQLSAGINMNKQDVENYVEPSNDELSQLIKILRGYFLSLDGSGSMLGDIKFAYSGGDNVNKILHSGNIESYEVNNNVPKPKILGFDIDLGDEVKAKYLFNPGTLQYEIIDQFPISTWKGLTKTEIIELVNYVASQIGIAWLITVSYVETARVYTLTTIDGKTYSQTFISKINNNLGNEPIPGTSNEFWIYLVDQDVPISEIVEELQPYVDAQVLIALQKFQTIEVYTTKQIDKLLLSKQDNLIVNASFTLKVNAFGSYIELERSRVLSYTFDTYSSDEVVVQVNYGTFTAFKKWDRVDKNWAWITTPDKVRVTYISSITTKGEQNE